MVATQTNTDTQSVKGKKPRFRDAAEKVSDVLWFKLDNLIVEEGFNVREENDRLFEHIDQLARSIAEKGVTTPLKVRPAEDLSKAIITDGHCRRRAAQRAVSEYGADPGILIPCIAESRYASVADRKMEILTSNSGLNLTPAEVSMLFVQMIGYGWNPTQIAKVAGYSYSHVTNLLGYNTAPESVKQMVADGLIASTTAVNVVRDHGPVAAEVILKEAVEIAEAAGKESATPKHVKAALLTGAGSAGKRGARGPTVAAKPKYAEAQVNRFIAVLLRLNEVDLEAEDANHLQILRDLKGSAFGVLKDARVV